MSHTFVLLCGRAQTCWLIVGRQGGAGAEGVDSDVVAEVGKMGPLSWSPWSKCRSESWTQMIIRIKRAQHHGRKRYEPRGVSTTMDEKSGSFLEEVARVLCRRHAERGPAVWQMERGKRGRDV